MKPLPENMRERVDTFISKWCGEYAPHLLDSDENDGERLRVYLEALLEEVHQQSIDTLEKAQLNMRPLIALKNGNGEIDGEWYVMHWDDKDQVWNRARYADIIETVDRKARIDELKEQLRNNTYTSGGTKVDYVPVYRLENRILGLEEHLQSVSKETTKNETL